MDGGRRREGIVLAAIVAANAVALAGSLAYGWGLADLLVLYWSEAVVLGVGTFARMLRHEHPGRLFFALFFLFHYGASVLFYLLAIGSFFLPGGPLAAPAAIPGVALGVLAFAARELAALLLRKEDLGIEAVMVAPYFRLLPIHAAIMVIAFATLFLGAPRGALVVLVLVKLLADVAWSVLERRARAAPVPVASGPEGAPRPR